MINANAIAGYLNTKASEIISIEEWQYVYFVKVNGFSPLFISKTKLALFVVNDKKAYNPGRFTHFDGMNDKKLYGKAYGKCPIFNSPDAKAYKAKLTAMWAAISIPASHPASALFPVVI